MKIAVYIKKGDLRSDSRFNSMLDSLCDAGCKVYMLEENSRMQEDTDILLAAGGDGTFLSASRLAEDSGVPILGVNFGRLGFLSETQWDEVARALVTKDYTIESRTLLHARVEPVTGVSEIDNWNYALNEVCAHRVGASMLGIDVRIGDSSLPTYWADGLLVATSSGSTAYSLSVGGPIVLPESEVLIISPISPHNLNVRPLIVPESSEITLNFQTRDPHIVLTLDNRQAEIDTSFTVRISKASFPLNRVRLNRSNFIDALVSKLFWGEDIRNYSSN